MSYSFVGSVNTVDNIYNLLDPSKFILELGDGLGFDGDDPAA